MLVELMELMQQDSGDDKYKWQEKARWIKYEEDYEAGSGHWGKPHVSCLSFHTLLELKNALSTGSFLRAIVHA